MTKVVIDDMIAFFLAAEDNRSHERRKTSKFSSNYYDFIASIIIPLILFTLIFSELERNFLLVGEACSACLERQKVLLKTESRCVTQK